MLVIKSHKILLETNQEHNKLFTSWCGAARWSYNYGLERKVALYQGQRQSTSAYTLMKEIVALKKTDEYAWLKNAPKSIPRMALLHLDNAYQHFFGRIKEDKAKKGFPRWKSRKRSKLAFHLEPNTVALDGKRVHIPKLGWLKMYQAVRFIGNLKGSICISKRAGRWYASFPVETDIGEVENQDKPVVGLDVGVKKLAVLSDGAGFENPKAFYRLERLLTRAQRQTVRKQKDSRRWERAKLRVERIHKRIADLRANATHRVSIYVARNYAGVALEDLNIAGMVQNRSLAKAVMDANFYELHRQLHYKMAWAGGEVRQVDRFFPSSKLCSICGLINDRLMLADREWTCDCGAHHNRDMNAAINLMNKCFGPGLGATARGRIGQEAPGETRTL